MGGVRLLCHACGYVAADPLERTCPADGRWLVAEAEHRRTPDDPYLGQLIGDRYPLFGQIGQGRRGLVYRTVHHNRVAVLRILTMPGQIRSPLARESFCLQAEALAAFEDPGVARLLDFGVTRPGLPFLVTEHVHAPSLRSHFQHGSLTGRQLLDAIGSVLGTLDALHRQGLLHGALRPENIMILPGWLKESRLPSVKLLDCGLPGLVQRAQGGRPELPDPTSACYRAPELVLGAAADQRSEIYAICAILAEGFWGRCLEADPRPALAGLPPDLSALLWRGLARHPRDRYASASAMLDALEVLSPDPLDHQPLPRSQVSPAAGSRVAEAEPIQEVEPEQVEFVEPRAHPARPPQPHPLARHDASRPPLRHHPEPSWMHSSAPRQTSLRTALGWPRRGGRPGR